MAAPNMPTAAASRKGVPATLPTVILWGTPVLITRIAPPTLAGRPSALAKLLYVPSERMPSGGLGVNRARGKKADGPAPPRHDHTRLGPQKLAEVLFRVELDDQVVGEC